MPKMQLRSGEARTIQKGFSMIDLIAAAGIGGIIGAGIMAWRTAGTVDDLRDKLFHTECEYEAETGITEVLVPKLREANAAHTRCADALTTCQRKLSAIRDLLDTPRTIRKGELASILDGDA